MKKEKIALVALFWGLGAVADPYQVTSDVDLSLSSDLSYETVEISEGATLKLLPSNYALCVSNIVGQGTLELAGGRVAFTYKGGTIETPILVSGENESRIFRRFNEAEYDDNTSAYIKGNIRGNGKIAFTGGGSSKQRAGIYLTGDNSGFTGQCRVTNDSDARLFFSSNTSGFSEGALLDECRRTGNVGTAHLGDDKVTALTFKRIDTVGYIDDDKYYLRLDGYNSQNPLVLTVKEGLIGHRLGENVTLVKEDEGDLTIARAIHKYGTKINGGTLTVVNTNALMKGLIYFNGGTLVYGKQTYGADGKPLETSIPITSDYSEFIAAASTGGPISIDTAGNDVIWSKKAVDWQYTGEFIKKGEGLLKLEKFRSPFVPTTVLGGTFYAYHNSDWLNGTVRVEKGATYAVYGRARKFGSFNSADGTVKLVGDGTIQFNTEEGGDWGWRVGSSVDYTEFWGTLEYASATNHKSAQGPLSGGDLSHVTLCVSGEPSEPARLMDLEQPVYLDLGAFQLLGENGQIYLKYEKDIKTGLKAGAESILNGQFINQKLKLTKVGETHLTLGPKFAALDDSVIDIYGGTFINYADLTKLKVTLHDEPNEPPFYLGGDFTRIPADMLAGKNYSIYLPVKPTEVDREVQYDLLTIPVNTTQPTRPALDEFNEGQTKGHWVINRVSAKDAEGNIIGVRFIMRFAKNGFVLILR